MVSTPFRLARAQRMAMVVSVEPAHNALNSLALLNAAEELTGAPAWVAHTAAALSAEQRRRHRLIFEEAGDVLAEEGTWPDFPAYLGHLAAAEPVALRDRALQRLWQRAARHGHHEAAGPLPDPSMLLADRAAFVALMERLAAGEARESSLHEDAWALLGDPPALQAMVVEHLRTLWEHALAGEWRRVQGDLVHQVRVFSARLDPAASVAHNFRMFTERDLPEGVHAVMAAVQRVIFVPSPHVGEHTTLVASGGTLRLFFGARRQYGSLLRSPIKRPELLMRLTALADDTRLRMLGLLAREDELSSQELMRRLDLGQSAASRHLQHLRSAGYVLERRGEGANKLFRLAPIQLDATVEVLARTLAGDDLDPAPDGPAAGTPPEVRGFLDPEGRVRGWPAREKDKLVLLAYLTERFERDRQYSEKEVNEVIQQNLAPPFRDFVTVRRALYDARHLERTRDGARYWRLPVE